MTEHNNARGQTTQTLAFDESAEQLNYYALIREWAQDRNIIGGGSSAVDQFNKGLSEAGELWDHIGENDVASLKDDIGDVLVCLTNSLGNMHLNFEDLAYYSAEELEVFREHYQSMGSWMSKRLGFLVLRSLGDASEAIEELQFEDDNQVVVYTEATADQLRSLIENETDLNDSLGAVVLALTLLAEHHGWTLNDCLAKSYSDIKDRKGVMYNGAFVKEVKITLERAQEMLASGTVAEKGTAYLSDLADRLTRQQHQGDHGVVS